MKRENRLGVVVHVCNHSTLEAGQKDRDFKVSLGYIARPSKSK
jgi:hypothetical protein